jgi:hypothetical protein
MDLSETKEFVDAEKFIQAVIYKKLERPLADNLCFCEFPNRLWNQER